MKTLYPEISPYHTFFLETGTQHAVYVEQSGNPDGIPVIFLHGGPCSGTKPMTLFIIYSVLSWAPSLMFN
jgi:proline iminopeptidase